MNSPLAFIDPSAKLGKNVIVHPFAYIDKDVEIGDNCEIFPYASVMAGTRMGADNKVYQGAVVGADPQDFRWKGQPTFCYIGNENIIREHVIINRGIDSERGTRIGNHNFIMANAHVGHDSVITDHCVLGNGVTMAGDCHVDHHTILSSNVVVHERSKVGKWTLVKGGCRITGCVPPYIILAHNPATYFGINAMILRRHDFTDEQVDEIAKAYRNIYQSGISVYNALQRIEADIEPSEIRSDIINFIRSANLRIVAVPIDMPE